MRRILLSIAALACIHAITGIALASESAAEDADQHAIYANALSMPEIQKFASALSALSAYAKQHPEVGESSSPGNQTIAQTVSRIAQHPPAVAILARNGLTPRQFALDTLTMIQTGMAVAMKRSGLYTEYPPQVRALVSAANLAFFEQHYDEIAKLVPAFAHHDRQHAASADGNE